MFRAELIAIAILVVLNLLNKIYWCEVWNKVFW